MASSQGTCYFCKETYSKRGIARHLRACDAKEAHEKEIQSAGGRRKSLFHIVADGYRTYWLHLEMPADATLGDLDSFLRSIWLECCGHLSAFRVNGTSYDSHPGGGWRSSKSMNVKLGKVLSPKMEFEHEYDFGSTTHLSIRVLDQHEGWLSKDEEPVRIMARNEPPKAECVNCGQPATQIDVYEWVVLCDECAEEQAEGWLPLVNSPRTGVCGYTGPSNPERFEP